MLVMKSKPNEQLTGFTFINLLICNVELRLSITTQPSS